MTANLPLSTRTIAVVLAALTVLAAVGGVASAAGPTTLSVSPAQQQITPGETTTVDVVLDDAAGGVGSGQIGVQLGNPGVADIVDVTAGSDPGSSVSTVANDGSSASVHYAFDDTADTGPVTVLTVTLEGTAAGSTDVSVLGPSDVGGPPLDLYFSDESGSGYDLTEVGSATVTVGAQNQQPTASIAGPASAQVGEDVTFEASASDDGSIAEYQWNFGDGATATGQSVTHAFDSAGDYDVTLTVTDDAGATASATQTVSVTAAPSPANFQVSNLDVAGPVTQGETTDISATIENAGDQAGTQTVSLSVDGSQVDTEDVTLAGGASQQVTFAVDTSGLSLGQHEAAVATDDDDATGQFEVTEAGDGGDGPPLSTEVTLAPTEDLVAVGQSATFDVVVENADGGVGVYDLDVALSDGEVASITDVELTGTAGPEVTDVQIADDGSEVSMEAVLVDTADAGSVSIGTVTVAGTAAGTTDLSAAVDELGNEAADGYDVAATNDASIDVSMLVVGDSTNPAQDPDGDGVYEDVNGDGAIDVLDVQALFAARHDAVVTDNAAAFDFNGDGTFSLLDVQTLYNEEIAQ